MHMRPTLLALAILVSGCAPPPAPYSSKFEIVLPPNWEEIVRDWVSQPTPPCFQGLGDLPGGPFSSSAYEISADGKAISGEGFDGTETTMHGKGVIWTRSGSSWSIARIPHVILGSNEENLAFCVAADGSTAGGYAKDS